MTRIEALTTEHCTVRRVLAVVVVTHAAPTGVLDRVLQSVRAHGGIDRLILVDNGSSMATRVEADEVLRTANRGYGAAANLGFGAALAAGAEHVALLNDDTLVETGWAAALVGAFDEPEIGAAQPALLDLEGEQITSLGVVLDEYGAGSDIGRGRAVGELPRATTPLEIFTGGAVVFTRDFLAATGGFDERFFMYYEDVDLARRGASLGWRYVLVPEARVRHAGGATTGRTPGRTRYLQERNRLWIARRHGDDAMWRSAVSLSVRRLRHRPITVHARALAAGLAVRW